MNTTTNEPLFPPAVLAACHTYYGVPLVELGEESELWALLGDIPERRVAAVVNAHWRDLNGRGIFGDTGSTLADVTMVTSRYQAVVVHGCKLGRSTFDDDGRVVGLGRVKVEGEHCCACEVQESPWSLVWLPEHIDHPAKFPVTVYDVEG